MISLCSAAYLLKCLAVAMFEMLDLQLRGLRFDCHSTVIVTVVTVWMVSCLLTAWFLWSGKSGKN